MAPSVGVTSASSTAGSWMPPGLGTSTPNYAHGLRVDEFGVRGLGFGGVGFGD